MDIKGKATIKNEKKKRRRSQEKKRKGRDLLYDTKVAIPLAKKKRKGNICNLQAANSRTCG